MVKILENVSDLALYTNDDYLFPSVGGEKIIWRPKGTTPEDVMWQLLHHISESFRDIMSHTIRRHLLSAQKALVVIMYRQRFVDLAFEKATSRDNLVKILVEERTSYEEAPGIVKENLVEALRMLIRSVEHPRKVLICGSGPGVSLLTDSDYIEGVDELLLLCV